MQIVINIPKVIYESCKKECEENDALIIDNYTYAIGTGTPLPKGHGRLIDADAYRKEMLDSREFDFFKRLDMQLTIIDAESEDEE